MYPVLFRIGNFTFYTHGFLAVIGIILGSGLLYFLAKRQKLDLSFLFDNIVWAVFFGIIGARLTYYFLYPSQFSSAREIFYLWDGGMVSYGGFVLGALTFYLFLRYQRQPILKWFDLMSQSFAVGLIFGRLGNIFAGEYAGLPTASHFSLEGRIPVTLYEALLLVVISFIILLIKRYYPRRKEGMVFFSFIIMYGFGRFLIDFWRDEKNLLWNISFGQLFGLLVVVAGVSGILWLKRTKAK